MLKNNNELPDIAKAATKSKGIIASGVVGISALVIFFQSLYIPRKELMIHVVDSSCET